MVFGLYVRCPKLRFMSLELSVDGGGEYENIENVK